MLTADGSSLVWMSQLFSVVFVTNFIEIIYGLSSLIFK